MHVTDSTQLSPRLTRQPLHVSLESARAADEGRLLERCLERASSALLAKQNAKGYWVGELQGDSILESEYILLKWILGQEDDPNLPPITNFLRSLQNADGTWPEDASTGTGFPNVFYLTYAMYRDYFPLLALATHAPAGSPLPTGLQL